MTLIKRIGLLTFLLMTGILSAQDKLSIAVIPKGTTHEFWKSIHAGAVKAGDELGVEIIWKGPQREDDREMQIQVVEDFISRKVSGIVLAPLDDKALARPVKEAMKRKVPVVIIDSGLQGKDFVSFVATDNYKGGVLAAEKLASLITYKKPRIIMLRYQEGSASTMERERGFYETIKSRTDADYYFMSDNQYAGPTVESAYQKAEDLLTRYRDEVDGIFCPNESSTFGMLRALKDAGLAGKVKFVGFDASEPLVAGLREGNIHGLVVQNPFKMGELGVRTIVAHIKGEKVEQRIDTGVAIVTPENIEQAEIKDLLSPPIDKYLK